ncbi:MAG TPA: glycerophosphodiester phosphodiesterase family protein [Desulfobacterales bacterium]|nr:glycerophosphodiester phosphodiesterase family protein [Desulfobacterales bacterium]
MNPSLDLTRFTRPLLIGHRGYPAKFPENTLASFEGAMQAGCDMIELDVTLTKDRKVVVIHDDTLDRTTTGKGPVRGHALAEIKALDAGSWFDARFASERVPELWEVTELTAGRCMLNIEIKESAFEATYPTDAIEHQVVRLVKTSGAMDRVIISSFDKRILQRIAAMDAPPAIAYISDHGADKRFLEMLFAMKAFSWHPLFKILTRDQVEMLHAAGLKVFPWTINTRAEAEKVLALGVDGLICNELRVMRAD